NTEINRISLTRGHIISLNTLPIIHKSTLIKTEHDSMIMRAIESRAIFTTYIILKFWDVVVIPSPTTVNIFAHRERHADALPIVLQMLFT
ncbi:MAG: hypothetical protein QW778_04705, partial [Candidatus Micrarchaeaceae archaeon]